VAGERGVAVTDCGRSTILAIVNEILGEQVAGGRVLVSVILQEALVLPKLTPTESVEFAVRLKMLAVC
jgi:hypothetical protein